MRIENIKEFIISKLEESELYPYDSIKNHDKVYLRRILNLSDVEISDPHETLMVRVTLLCMLSQKNNEDLYHQRNFSNYSNNKILTSIIQIYKNLYIETFNQYKALSWLVNKYHL